MKEKFIPGIVELDDDEYGAYYAGYISNIQKGSVVEILNSDMKDWESLFTSLTDKEGLKAYAPGKWTVKEMILHCIDTERIFCTRALMIARGESNNIPGYDHEAYVDHSNANDRSLESLKLELFNQRTSTQTLFDTFSDAELKRRGIANENRLSVRAAAYIIPGHCKHHMKVLREKYELEF